jgi:hypothetical protein
MDMALIIAPILFIATVIYVAYPLLREQEESLVDETEKTEREKALEEKEEVIVNLKDIEMDYRMGKLSAEDYLNLKADFEQQAVRVFQDLESLKKRGRSKIKKS